MRARKRIWLVAAAVAAGLVSFAANAGQLLVVNAPERSDVILVLAGETDHRPARGLELLDQGYGARLVIDVPATTKIYEFTQVQLAEKYAEGLPEVAAVRICPIVGLSTRDESHDAEQCLAREKGNRVLIVTSDFHTRRSLSIFRHEVRGKHWRNGSDCYGGWSSSGGDENRLFRGASNSDEFSTGNDIATPKRH